jgi:hypothetical protein
MMFELSLGTMLAVIVLFLYPSLLTMVLRLTGSCILALIAGGISFSLGTTVGLPVENAIWMAIPFCLFGGAGGMTGLTHFVSERRGPARFTDPG